MGRPPGHVGIRAEQHHHGGGRGVLGPQDLAQLHAVHAVELVLEDGEGVGAPGAGVELEGVLGRLGLVDDEPPGVEGVGEHGPGDGVVVDDEGPEADEGVETGLDLGLHALGQRERHPEAGADPQLAVDVDRAALEVDEVLDDRQAEAGAAVVAGDRVVGLGEGLEQAGASLLGDADAGVDDLEGDLSGSDPAGTGPDDHRALVGELDRVGGQVEEDLAEPQRIALAVVVDRGVAVGDDLRGPSCGRRRRRSSPPRR